jgi:ABC-type cobalamin/Fe3+-siderophores transport system ATPase subunit
MSVLELEHVSVRCGDRGPGREVLRDVSLSIEERELVVVWGRRRSGRTTLMRVAAGVQAPDSGVVRFDGRDLKGIGDCSVPGGIAYCRKSFRPTEGRSVLDQLMRGPLTRGASASTARSLALRALTRTGAEDLSVCRPADLGSSEAMRVAIARSLTREPRLLVIDEPTIGVELGERDDILLLLRALADEDGLGILASTGEGPCLSGADRALSLSEGKLRGTVTPELATVLPLRPTASRWA